jgi:hypothetical protein
MYNYIQLADETQIAHSGILEDSTVKICVERPSVGGFDSATCYLPLCEWTNSQGFSESELLHLGELIKDNAPLIYRLAKEQTKQYA